MNKQEKINSILESNEFIQSLKKLDEEHREIVENSARQLLGDLFSQFESTMTEIEKIKSRRINKIDIGETNVVREKE